MTATTSPQARAESKRYFTLLGAHIAQLRKARGMTQGELARAIGVSQQAVFAYEIGERRTSVFVLSKIAKALTVAVEDLSALRIRAPVFDGPGDRCRGSFDNGA